MYTFGTMALRGLAVLVVAKIGNRYLRRATVVGLARLAIGGFASGAHPPLTALAVLACGILATISSGHPGAKGTSTALPAWQPHASG